MDRCTAEALATINAAQIERLKEEARAERVAASGAWNRAREHGDQAKTLFEALDPILATYTTARGITLKTEVEFTVTVSADDAEQVRVYQTSHRAVRDREIELIDDYRRAEVSDDVWALVKPEILRMHNKAMWAAAQSRAHTEEAQKHDSQAGNKTAQAGRLASFNTEVAT